jgi:hypothetical protein
MAHRPRHRPRHAWAAALLAVGVLAQAGGADASGIFGYLDPATGAFRIATPQRAVASAAVTAVSKGTIAVSFTIGIASAIPANSPITCAVTANVYLAANPYAPITDSASAVATRNGAVATCRVTIPYLWSGYGSSDVASLWYEISAAGRDTQQPLANIKVPATGTTTSFSVTPSF